MSNKINYTVKKFLSFLSLTCLLLFIKFQPVNAFGIQLEDKGSLELFGIGIHQEKRVDVYVGALFAPIQVTSPNQLSDLNLNKRMSLKFVSKYSNRKMARFWKQRIAMNNSRDNWRPFTKEIIAFANIFKSPIQPGDEINIDYIASQGTLIYLNGTHFLTIKKQEFFELLLNIWIGTIPPSESFKKGITGQNNDSDNTNLISQFESIQPIIGRFDADKASQTQIVTKVASSTPNPTAKITEKKVTKTTPKKSVAKEPNEIDNQKAANETKKLVEALKTDLPITRTQIEKPVIERSNQDLTSQSTKLELPPQNHSNTKDGEKDKTTHVANIEPERTNIKSDLKEKVAKLEPVEEKLFDADLMAGSYTLELINNIRKHQSYPKKALREGLEGSLRIQIKIDTAGEIIDSSFIERSGERVLDRAAMKMLRKAQPFPAIPKELGLLEFEFEVPMNFSMTD